jgi:hypothetical protein
VTEPRAGAWRWLLQHERHVAKGAYAVFREHADRRLGQSFVQNGHEGSLSKVMNSAGIMLGDVGSMYFFRCDACSSHRWSGTCSSAPEVSGTSG